MRSPLVFITASLLIVSSLFVSSETRGCGIAPRRLQNVGVNAEEAIIVYDSQTKTEHFIRRANFRTESKDFGFLVPTPSKPELGETDAYLFDRLHTATLPRVVDSGKVRQVTRRVGAMVDSAAPNRAAPAAPKVLEEKTVAGFDAVVLQADDTDGLKKWLEEHQYDARPALMEWLQWYVEHKWIITAFKISQAPNANLARWNTAVRMSFATDTPFYPYREPADMRAAPPPEGRTLRVFFLSDKRYAGTIGQQEVWPGKTVWSNPIQDALLNSLAGGLRLPAPETAKLEKSKWVLTEFEDLSAPRPGTDEVYFKPSEDQSQLERPVIYQDRIEYVDGPLPGSPEAEERSIIFKFLFGGILGASAIGVLVGRIAMRTLRG